LVLLLTAQHGVLSGRLHRLARSQEPSAPASPRHAAAAVLIATFIIVVLVVSKPN
jgi:putative membrane protein